ncbi:MAG: PKD domain-containing protein [Thermoplasmata archaeon]
MPGARLDGGLVWDSTDGYSLLFGGDDYGASPLHYYNDTWKFSGGVWTNLTNVADAPEARSGFEMANDPGDDEVVLFGGVPDVATVPYHDTWTYAGGVWTNISSTVSTPPPNLYWGAMAYDNTTSSVILFGGVEMSVGDYTNETWSFHAGQWTQLLPTVSPPARNSESMVWDPQANELLMFGGQDESGSLNDTWGFTGSTWVQLTTTGAPNPRWGAGLAYFPPLHQVVLFAGNGAPNYDEYTYASGMWTAYAATSPNPGQTTGLNDMTYDYGDNYVLMTQESLDYANYTWALNLTSGASPPPLQVTVSAMPQSGSAPLQVDFTSDVSGGTPPYTYAWTFGDGGTSTLAAPTYGYPSAGMFTATLVVTDHAGAMISKSVTITVSKMAPIVGGQSTSWGSYVIVGIGIIALVIVIILTVFVILPWNRRRKNQPPPASNSPPGPPGAGPSG